jgi:hypothetical protein
MLRTSERAAFMRCPQAWYWGYVEGLTPIQERKEAADFGSLFHIALAEYYQPGTVRGMHPADSWDRLANQHISVIKTQELVNDELVNKWEDFHELGLQLAEAYVEHYQGDPHWDVLDAERRFAVTIPDVRVPPKIHNGKRGFTPICTLVGTFDLCYRDLSDGLVKMVDHKTATAIYTGHLALDPQASTYIAVATHALREQGLIGPKEIVKGMEYNFIRKGKVDDRPQNERGEYLNKNGSVSKQQGRPLFQRYFVPRTLKERQRTIVRISQESAIMADIAAGKIPIVKNTARDCAFCKFYDLCELDEAGEDTQYFKETVFKKHDPWFDHRPEAINSKKVTQ